MVKNVLNTLRKKQKNNKGFSLVELIVVIAIMAVLVGVLAPQLIKYVEKSRESTDIQNCDSIVTALKSYYADKDTLPTTVTVELTSSNITLKEDTAASTEPLSGSGLANAKLKGKKWDGITITYTPADGTVAYAITNGTNAYYEVKTGNDTQIVAK